MPTRSAKLKNEPTEVKVEDGNDYESQRQANIAKNKALLQQLQLSAASAGLAPPKQRNPGSAGKTAQRKRPAPKKVKEEDEGPRRTSSRLKGIMADSEVQKRKWEEEEAQRREDERAKRMRMSGDVSIADNWTMSGNFLRTVRPANPYERTFDENDVKETTSKELKELRTTLSGLKLWEDVEPAAIKITPERIYCMGFHPTEEKGLVFAGDKMGNLGMFDSTQDVSAKDEDGDDEETEDVDGWAPVITSFKPHTRTISAIHFTSSQPQNVYTSSYDSSIRKFDLEKGISTEVYAPTEQEMDEPLSGVSIPMNEPHMLYFASLNGGFGIHDTRTESKRSTTSLLQLSEKKIGGFSVHPLHPHLVATASLDRTLKLWDLRALHGRGSGKMPELIAEHTSKLSVSHAAFNAVGDIATSSYDDTIKVHHLNQISGSGPGSWKPGHSLTVEQFEPQTIIPHNNQTGRWVTILRPHWQQVPTGIGGGTQRFCIGNMNRFVDVYAGSGEQLAQLGGDGITAVPAVAVFHPTMDRIAAGTASGKLCLWI